jgi:hypothetical protein
MRPSLAAAEERAWLETYLADLMNNQRVLVYAYASLERLVGQLETCSMTSQRRRWLWQPG